MLITTQIQTSDPNFPWDAAAAAAQVLAALGGNASNDTSTATVQKQATVIVTNVSLQEGDQMFYNAEAAADQVMAALGGNPTKDTVTVSMTMQTTFGHAGI